MFRILFACRRQEDEKQDQLAGVQSKFRRFSQYNLQHNIQFHLHDSKVVFDVSAAIGILFYFLSEIGYLVGSFVK